MSGLILKKVPMQESMSIINRQVTGHTDPSVGISIKDRRRMTAEMDMVYGNSMVVALLKNVNIKQANNMVTFNKMALLVPALAFTIKGSFMVYMYRHLRILKKRSIDYMSMIRNSRYSQRRRLSRLMLALLFTLNCSNNVTAKQI